MGLYLCVTTESVEGTLFKGQSPHPPMMAIDPACEKSRSEQLTEPKEISTSTFTSVPTSNDSVPSPNLYAAEIALKSPLNDLRGKSSLESSSEFVPTPADQLNITNRFRRDKRSSLTWPPRLQYLEGSESSTFDPVPMTTILPHIYLGSYEDAINETQLQANGITHILSLIGNKSPVGYVKHKNFPMNDRGKTDLKRVLKKVSKFMKVGQNDAKRVLVHCFSGQNRSAAVVIALMMINQKNTLYRAYKRVKSLRPIIQINERYAKQLLALEKEIFGKNTLPNEWMERGEIDPLTGEVTYKYENIVLEQH